MSARLTKHGRYASTHYPSSTNESDSSNALYGPPLPTDTVWGRPGEQPFSWDHEHPSPNQSCSPSTMIDGPTSPTSYYLHHSNTGNNSRTLAKTVFSTSSSIDSLQEYNKQQQQQQQVATSAELLKENNILAQKNALAQQEVNSARNNQVRLENQVYELDQSLAEARKESQRLLRAKKDCDRQLEQNNAAFEKERALWAEREVELARSLKFATRPLVVQPAAKEERNTFDKEPSDALPPMIQQQIAENTAVQARALRAQERIVADLRQQILALNQDVIERQHSFRLRETELQGEVNQARELNRGLMEENESYQLLLHEKSMNGEFMQTSIMKGTDYGDNLPGTPLVVGNNGSVNLADELGRAFGQFPPTPPAERSNESLVAEISELRDDKTALQLYIAKILSRLMELPGFTRVLAADYSPGRAAVSESPTAVIKSSENNSSIGSVIEQKEDEIKESDKQESQQQPLPQKTPGRGRSQSLLQGFFGRSKPSPAVLPTSTSAKSSERGSSDDDSASSRSARGLTSFQDGHTLEDSPRTSYSSADYAVVAYDHPPPAECEQLTTFSNPYTSKELRRQSSLSVSSQQVHKRRQTIGSTGAPHLKGGNHGRYVSESSALPSSLSQPSTTSNNNRRSTLSPGKNNLNVLPPMPELSHNMISSLAEEKTPPTPQERAVAKNSDSMSSVRSPTLSITTSESSSASTLSTAVATPTTPIATKKTFRFSFFGGGGSSNSTATTTSSNTATAAQSPSSEETPDTKQQITPASTEVA